MQGPPPEFPLASTNPGIVRHLSGLSGHAHTRDAYTCGGRGDQPPSFKAQKVRLTTVTFISHSRIHPVALACTLNSLVRVSRRDVPGRCSQ